MPLALKSGGSLLRIHDAHNRERESTAMHTIIASLGFPLWLRVTHYINLLFIGLLIRSGIQILAAHPRLYWTDSSNPRKAWLKLTKKKVPEDKLYTSMDDEEPVTPVLALPGKDNLGLGRHWHFFSVIFWALNGLIYVILLFATGEWSRLIPTSWSIIPDAWHTFLTYITFHIPPASDFHPYDPLQQLAYAGVVFILAPLMILTGAAMSPSIEGRFPWYIKIFGGKQGARSIHFLVMLAFTIFVIIHTALVLIVHFTDNIRNIVFGTLNSDVGAAILIAVIALVIVAAIYIWRPGIRCATNGRCSMRWVHLLILCVTHCCTVRNRSSITSNRTSHPTSGSMVARPSARSTNATPCAASRIGSWRSAVW